MKIPKRPETPMADKWATVHERWESVFDFYGWLRDAKGYFLSEYVEEPCWKCGGEGEIMSDDGSVLMVCPECYGKKKIPHQTPFPVMKSLRGLFYEYADIDPQQLERDRRALLDYMRRLNEEEEVPTGKAESYPGKIRINGVRTYEKEKKNFARIKDEDGNIIKVYEGHHLQLPEGTYQLLDPLPDNCTVTGVEKSVKE